MNESCTIQFVRPGGYVDAIRSYELRINGESVGTIGRASQLEVRRPAGVFSVEARIDWCRSAPLAVDAKPGETVTIEVKNNWGALLALWAIVFSRGTYLRLARAG